MWMKASSATVEANATVITINSGESMANAVAGDAAILGDKPPVEVADSAQVNGAWQLSLQDPWPYEALNNVALRVQPNGGRFENAIGAMRRTNTTANNILAGMRDWLTSTEKTITVTDAGGKAYTVPTLANLGTASGEDIGEELGDVLGVGTYGLGTGLGRFGNIKLESGTAEKACKLMTIDSRVLGYQAPATFLLVCRHYENIANTQYIFLSIGGGKATIGAKAVCLGQSGQMVYLYIDNSAAPESCEVWLKTRTNYLRASVYRISSGGAPQSQAGVFGGDPSSSGGALTLVDDVPSTATEIDYTFTRTTDNTTEDSNGFIKSASPIIKLYPDHIENNDLAADAQLTKNGTGDYTIKGTLGLATEGWYIETPKDANGNIKVYVEYEQSEDEGKPVINVRTYVPDYSTGPVSAGEPVDIPEGRFITIRCNEPDDELDENKKDSAG